MIKRTALIVLALFISVSFAMAQPPFDPMDPYASHGSISIQDRMDVSILLPGSPVEQKINLHEDIEAELAELVYRDCDDEPIDNDPDVVSICPNLSSIPWTTGWRLTALPDPNNPGTYFDCLVVLKYRYRKCDQGRMFFQIDVIGYDLMRIENGTLTSGACTDLETYLNSGTNVEKAEKLLWVDQVLLDDVARSKFDYENDFLVRENGSRIECGYDTTGKPTYNTQYPFRVMFTTATCVSKFRVSYKESGPTSALYQSDVFDVPCAESSCCKRVFAYCYEPNSPQDSEPTSIQLEVTNEMDNCVAGANPPEDLLQAIVDAITAEGYAVETNSNSTCVSSCSDYRLEENQEINE